MARKKEAGVERESALVLSLRRGRRMKGPRSASSDDDADNYTGGFNHAALPGTPPLHHFLEILQPLRTVFFTLSLTLPLPLSLSLFLTLVPRRFGWVPVREM